MKRLGYFVLLGAAVMTSAPVCAAGSNDAMWTEVYQAQLDPESAVAYYIEPRTVTRSGHTAAFWDKIVNTWVGEKPVILISHVVVNCETQETGANAFASDEKSLYEGKILSSGEIKWEVAAPNSGSLAEVRKVCR